MNDTIINKFRAINDFPKLVEYLGTELDWPIETNDFEEITFEYSANELNLSEKIVPKFLEIRRLRPLEKNQPWGIFFVRFDDNKLPVVALRRLLNKLVLKKRSNSNFGDRASWHESDLLLISQIGGLDKQSISFAHFSSNPNKMDLPILKVLGWDDDDTGLKVDYVIDTLRSKLIWPDDPTDSDAWRAQWRDAFTLKNREVIQNSKEMAKRLGELALAVRTRLRELLSIENDQGPINKLMSAFKENLISDLNTDSFSDMYAQTIAYGLLSARIINPKANTADAVYANIPITNPFLRDLMDTFLNLGGRNNNAGGLDFDELGINEVVELLDNTNMEAVLRDFGDLNREEDPVMHFFEGFLQEYDNKIRKDRGVFYTPQPVVSFIVRSVDEQLRRGFGLKDGLADTTTWGELARQFADLKIPKDTSPNQAFVQILDPATGTGTFPVEVIDLIYKTMTVKWQLQGNRESQIKELWNEYVPQHLLPRLHGYELMMAPYAIAHMKVGLKLYETGYRFKSNERARIYLTNALEPFQDNSGTFAFAIPSLARESAAVNQIKKNQVFTVLLGNPPYSKVSQNMSTASQQLIESYKYVDGAPLGERKHWLQDDYVKFFAFFQLVLKKSEAGVLGVITNHAYLDNPTFRGMRQNLLKTFKAIYIIDLHGNLNKGEKDYDGFPDENVFAIRQGVGVTVAIVKHNEKTLVRYSELFGSRELKYSELQAKKILSIDFAELTPTSPYYFFVPKDLNKNEEYQNYFAINEIFPIHSTGVLTGRDHFVIDFEDLPIKNRVQIFIDENISDKDAAISLGLSDNSSWKIAKARKELRSEGELQNRFENLHYRPFDKRRFLNHPSVVWRPRSEVMSNLGNQKNVALITSRMAKGEKFSHVFVSREKIEVISISSKTSNNAFVFPLFILDTQNLLNYGNTRTNISEKVLSKISTAFRLSREDTDKVSYVPTPETLFDYIYGILHSPNYRSRYGELLKIEFPRIPFPNNFLLFQKIRNLGSELKSLHLFENQSMECKLALPIDHSDWTVEKVSYSKDTVWINNEKTCGFKRVPEEVWKFHIGGYQVCEKWLKDRQAKGGKNSRPGRILTKEDIKHYQKIVFALSETIRIIPEIDKTIDSYGGWPDAFFNPNTIKNDNI